MHLVPLASIVVGERQRKELKPADQESLMQSLLNVGLLHAIVVEVDHNGFGNGPTGDYRLIAGERRYRAINQLSEFGSRIFFDGKLLDLGMIPVTYRHELSEPQRKEIELEENLRRVNLSWQEETQAVATLHAMREAANPTQTFNDTREELASMGRRISAGGEVARAVTVAKHLANPKVAGARNLKEALNIIVKDAEAEVRADLLQASEQSSEHQLHLGSCIEILQRASIVDPGWEPFDCILTDSPYGMEADNFGTVGPSHSYIDSWENAAPIYSAIFREGFRLCKPDAHLYAFCDIEHFLDIRAMAEHEGWQTFRTPIIWHKTASMGHDPLPQKGFRRSSEYILYAMKGNRPYQVAMSDVIPCPNISSPYHPAAKPPELFASLIHRSCIPGDRVLDPCCGVGTIFEAARLTKTIATGIEIDPAYAKVADNKRFEELA